MIRERYIISTWYLACAHDHISRLFLINERRNSLIARPGKQTLRHKPPAHLNRCVHLEGKKKTCRGARFHRQKRRPAPIPRERVHEFLQRGVWRFLRYFSEILARVDSAPVQHTSLVGREISTVATGPTSATGPDTCLSTCSDTRRAKYSEIFFSTTKTRSFSEKFNAILSSLT